MTEEERERQIEEWINGVHLGPCCADTENECPLEDNSETEEEGESP